MAIPLTINGATFEYPQNFDENWGVEATGWAQAVTNGMLQMSGGSFPLTADVNFGPNFGLLSKYFETRSSNPATTGTVRLSSADAGIAFRNNANSGNLILTTNASDQLVYNGTPVGSGVSSVSGTANQINSTGGTTPVLSLSSTLIFPGTATGTLTGHSTLDLALTGGTMSGAIAMGTNKVTGLAVATVSGDALSWGQSFTSGQITFSPTTTGIKGTTTNDSAAAGNVGEYIEAKGTGAVNFPATTVYSDVDSITLTAGDWDIRFNLRVIGNGATVTAFELAVTTNPGNDATGIIDGQNAWSLQNSSANLTNITCNAEIPPYRVSLSGTTTYYLKLEAVYSAGTPQYAGYILSARRVR